MPRCHIQEWTASTAGGRATALWNTQLPVIANPALVKGQKKRFKIKEDSVFDAEGREEGGEQTWEAVLEEQFFYMPVLLPGTCQASDSLSFSLLESSRIFSFSFSFSFLLLF